MLKEQHMTFKNEDKLNPPAYVPSEAEIKLAKIRLIFDDEIFSIIEDLKMYVMLKEKGEVPTWLTEERIKKDALNAVEEWNAGLANWFQNDWWEAFDPKDHYNYIVDGLSSIHIGDCTAHPATCTRCLAEEYFHIPPTANWSKSEGSKMFHEYSEDVKKSEK